MRTSKATRLLAIFCVALISQSVAEIDDEEHMSFPQANLQSGYIHRVLVSSSGKKIEVKAKIS